MKTGVLKITEIWKTRLKITEICEIWLIFTKNRAKKAKIRLNSAYFARFHAISGRFTAKMPQNEENVGPFLFLIFWGQDI